MPDIQVTQADITQIVKSMLTRLSKEAIKAQYGTVANGMCELKLWDFIYHEAEVIAYLQADVRRLDKVIHDAN